MQTAMQQLINEIVEHLTYDDDLTEDSRIALETIRLRCLGKLEMEKEQMIQCALCLHNIDMSKTGTDILIDEAEQYYNKTYGGEE